MNDEIKGNTFHKEDHRAYGDDELIDLVFDFSEEYQADPVELIESIFGQKPEMA